MALHTQRRVDEEGGPTDRRTPRAKTPSRWERLVKAARHKLRGILAFAYRHRHAVLLAGGGVLLLWVYSRGGKRVTAAVVRTDIEGPSRSRVAPEVVAVGDLHGDVRAFEKILQRTGLVDAQGNWEDKANRELNRRLVLTGDVVDGCRGGNCSALPAADELKLMDYIALLQKQAGDRLVVLQGNHEQMTLTGHSAGYSHPENRALPEFKPGGKYYKMMASWPSMKKIGNVLFAHAGLGADGRGPDLDTFGAPSAIIERENARVKSLIAAGRAGGEELYPRQWDRSVGAGSRGCGRTQELLNSLGADFLVVGHSVQPRGISSGCDGRVLRIDTANSAAFGLSDFARQHLLLRPGSVPLRVTRDALRGEPVPPL
jgi:hypothetical protein